MMFNGKRSDCFGSSGSVDCFHLLFTPTTHHTFLPPACLCSVLFLPGHSSGRPYCSKAQDPRFVVVVVSTQRLMVHQLITPYRSLSSIASMRPGQRLCVYKTTSLHLQHHFFPQVQSNRQSRCSAQGDDYFKTEKI